MWCTVITGIGSTDKGAPPALAGAGRVLAYAYGRDGLSHAEFNAGVRENPIEFRVNMNQILNYMAGWGHQGACGCDLSDGGVRECVRIVRGEQRQGQHGRFDDG